MDLKVAVKDVEALGWDAAATKHGLSMDALRGRIRRSGLKAGPMPSAPRKPANRANTKPETRLIVPDCHVPAHDRRAWSILLSVAKDLAPDRCIIMGDFIDMASLSHHPRRQPDVIKFAEEMAAGNRALDELESVLPGECSKTFLEGNHEGWSRSFEAENGALESILAVDKHLRLHDRGWDWVSLFRQDDFAIGPVAYLHGISEAKSHAAKHAEEFAPRVGKRHVCYGHMHTMQVATSNAGYTARCSGFLGEERNVAFAYKKGRPAPWVLGFLVQEVYGDCVTDTEVRITHGRACFRGKVY